MINNVSELSNEEAQHLTRLLSDPVYRKSVEIVCAQLWASNRDKSDMESAALAWAYADGVCSGFSTLHQMAQIKTAHSPTTRRFKTEAAIK